MVRYFTYHLVTYQVVSCKVHYGSIGSSGSGSRSALTTYFREVIPSSAVTV